MEGSPFLETYLTWAVEQALAYCPGRIKQPSSPLLRQALATVCSQEKMYKLAGILVEEVTEAESATAKNTSDEKGTEY